MLENPIASAALVCLFLGLGLSGFARLVPATAVLSLGPAILFLASYILTYQQLPSFPPLGATHKIFYIVILATLAGFILDLVSETENVKRLLLLITPLLIVSWIGLPRFTHPDFDLIAISVALSVGGAVILWRLNTVVQRTAERDGGSLVGFAILISLLLGFAPIALLGGSSTSLMVCFATAAGLAAMGLWEFAKPQAVFGFSVILGAGSAFLAMVDTVTLITRATDFAALALLLLIPYMGQVAARFMPRRQIHGRVRQLLIGVLAASPLLLVLAVLLLRHPGSFIS